MTHANESPLKVGVSVVICSFNGAARLPETLAHVAAQDCPSVPGWEVVLVDNASQDGTAQAARDTWERLKGSVTLSVLHEPTPGKDAALRRAFSHIKYHYVVICDDDNWLAPNYVETAFAVMEGNPTIGILGGQSIPECEERPPGWFYTYCGAYAVGAPAVESGDVSGRTYLWGAGSVLRAELLREAFVAGIHPVLSGARQVR